LLENVFAYQGAWYFTKTFEKFRIVSAKDHVPVATMLPCRTGLLYGV